MKKRRINSTDTEEPRSAAVPAKLSSRLEERLASYAIAAGAAGVGLLALASPAKADIIFDPGSSCSPNCVLDLNHDGLSDFSISVRLSFFDNGHSFGGSTVVIAHNDSRGYGVFGFPLKAGAPIGPGAPFRNSSSLAGWRSACSRGGGCFGGVFGGGNGYLGLTFGDADGQVHFGWARLSVHAQGRGDVGYSLLGAAYQTVPNKPILAGQGEVPEPATLGLLALGSLGIAAWRRKKAVSNDK